MFSPEVLVPFKYFRIPLWYLAVIIRHSFTTGRVDYGGQFSDSGLIGAVRVVVRKLVVVSLIMFHARGMARKLKINTYFVQRHEFAVQPRWPEIQYGRIR
jgi:hypothetical protein